MKGKKNDKKKVYSDQHLTALLKKSEIVIGHSKCKSNKEQSDGKEEKQ